MRPMLLSAFALAGCMSLAPIAADDPILVGTNEPFWSLELRDDVVLVTTIEAPEPAEYRVVTRADGLWIAEREAAQISVRIAPGPCFDDMSGARFPLVATVTLDGRTNRGCARRASDPRPEPA